MNQAKKNDIKIPSYWEWLFKGIDGRRPGIAAYFNAWLILHIVVSLILTNTVSITDNTALALSIPFFGVLIAIAVAWCGNSVSLLCTEEVLQLVSRSVDGVESYAFIVQNVVLILFVALILWLLKGFNFLGGCFFDFLVFLFSCLAVRDSWNVILFTQLLTIARMKIILKNMNKENNEDKH